MGLANGDVSQLRRRYSSPSGSFQVQPIALSCKLPGILLEEFMHSRTVIAGFLIALVSFTLSVRAAAQGTWAVENTFHVGGDGGMD